jgi:hypothetical protein
VIAVVTRLDEHIAETLGCDRFQEDVLAASLNYETAATRGTVVEISANDFADRLWKDYSGSDTGGRLQRYNLILSKLEGDDLRLSIADRKRRKQYPNAGSEQESASHASYLAERQRRQLLTASK